MNDVKIRIDTKNYRICIHRTALKAIGEPPFLNFIYDTESLRFMVVGKWKNDFKSVRVRYDSNGSVYVYSKLLLEAFQKVSNILTEPGSYLVDGSVRAESNMLVFLLGESVRISNDDENADFSAAD